MNMSCNRQSAVSLRGWMMEETSRIFGIVRVIESPRRTASRLDQIRTK